MERLPELCTYYIAMIRSVALVHQNNHWLSKGNDFYGNHLLLDRIYKSAAENADAAAERFIGLFGNEALDLHMQAQIIGKTLEGFTDDSPLEMSLKAEEEFLKFAERFYSILDEQDKLTLGLEDLLPAVASAREEACYLLKQALNVSGKDESEVDFKMAARKRLLGRMRA